MIPVAVFFVKLGVEFGLLCLVVLVVGVILAEVER